MNNDKGSLGAADSGDSTFVPPATPLLKKIGYGTGVSVYHLDRSPLNHAARSPWALKKVNKEHQTNAKYQKRMDKEAKILKDLSHPNIVGFRGYTKTEDGRKVLAMEECSTSLGNMIFDGDSNDRKIFKPKEILTVVIGVAKGLQYLHEEKGLLHGDVKSYNVLIQNDFEEVKLCDFGVSLPLASASVDDYVGTGPWSAPETLENGPITDKADIFSLGLIIWEMVTSRVPNIKDIGSDDEVDDDSLELFDDYGSTPAWPEDLPSEYSLVKEIYEWCCRQKYQQRPTARELLHRLSESGK